MDIVLLNPKEIKTILDHRANGVSFYLERAVKDASSRNLMRMVLMGSEITNYSERIIASWIHDVLISLDCQ